MAWYKNRTIVRYATVGFLAGFAIPISGFLLEFNMERLPYTLESLFFIQQSHPLIWIMELAPLFFCFAAGMMGQQHSFSTTLSQTKKEWEIIFDAFSDPFFITDKDGYIIRCNHAVLDRLNATYMKVLGRKLTEVLSEGQKENAQGVNYSGGETQWLGRIYDMSVCPINIEGMPKNEVYILHDMTERVRSNEQLRKL